MNDLPLFRSLRDEAPRCPPDLNYIRKSLNRLLRIVRNAQIMPWSEAETKSWERQFPALAGYLPAEEADALISEFRNELILYDCNPLAYRRLRLHTELARPGIAGACRFGCDLGDVSRTRMRCC